MTVVETYPTLDAAARAMGGDAAFLAGGTIVMRAVNEGAAPARLIRVTDRTLSEVQVTGEKRSDRRERYHGRCAGDTGP